MSSHGHSGGGGGGGDQSRTVSEKADIVKHLQTQGPHGIQHIMTQPLQAGTLLQGGAKAILTNRAIAPAPVPAGSHLQAALPISVSATGQVVSGQGLPKQVPVLSGGLGNIIHDPSRHIGVGQGATPVAVNLSGTPTIVTTASFAVTPSGSTSVQTQSTVQSVTLPGALHSSSSGIMASQVQLPMASLIRASIPQVVAPQGGAQPGQGGATTQPVVVSHSQPTHTLAQTPIVHAFPTHMPRGAAAASALTAPRGSAVATPMLRPTTQPNIVQIPISSGATQGMAQAHHPPRALLQVRPGTPPVTRSGSPSSALQMAQGQADAHRVGMALPGQGATSNTTVQITIQPPPRTIGDLTRAQLPTPSPTTPKGTPFSQSIVQSAHQKLVMSQATVTPIIQQPVTAATTVMGVAASRIGQAPIALNLSQSLGRPQKVLVNPSSLGGATQVQTSMPTLGGSSQSFALNQPLSRTQKIVMSQTTISHTMPTGTIITTAPKNVTGAAALNLSQTGPRAQKVVMPHVSISGPPLISPTAIQATPKTVSAPISIQHAVHTTGITTVTATAVSSSIPIAKITPQRQIIHAAHPGHDLVVRETAPQGQPQQQPAGGQAHTPQPQGGILLSQAQRAVGTGSAPTVTVSSTTQSESRPAAPDRPGFPSPMPYATIHPEYGAYYGVNYQNLMYPSVAGQTLTSLPSGSLRPTFATVQGQTSNLAATLQAAAAHGVRVSTAGTVNVNPMMVTVDQARHAAAVTVHAQYAPTADPKASHAPVETAANASTGPAPPHPPTGASAIAPVAHPPRQASPGITGSPRPSILRKRPSEGVALAKKNLMAAVSAIDTPSQLNESSGTGQGHLVSPRSNVHDQSHENSQSSTDTASSAESTPQSGVASGVTSGVATEVKVKQEPLDSLENANSNNNEDVSPRKQRRKQLLQTTEELRDGNSTDDELRRFTAKVNLKKELENAVVENLKQEVEDVEEYMDEDGVRWVRDRKRPPVVQLMNFYQCTWKAKQNHYLRYTDVKAKEERRPTVNELANQKGIHQKASGWKFYHLAAQLEEMIDNEREVHDKLTSVQAAVAPKHVTKHPTMEDDIGMVHELSQGNIQRCKLLMDQIHDSRTAMLKVLNHKKRILDIINKHHSKRPVKKKERI